MNPIEDDFDTDTDEMQEDAFWGYVDTNEDRHTFFVIFF